MACRNCVDGKCTGQCEKDQEHKKRKHKDKKKHKKGKKGKR
jgi:hypothetical protein